MSKSKNSLKMLVEKVDERGGASVSCRKVCLAAQSRSKGYHADLLRTQFMMSVNFRSDLITVIESRSISNIINITIYIFKRVEFIV